MPRLLIALIATLALAGCGRVITAPECPERTLEVRPEEGVTGPAPTVTIRYCP